MLASLCLPQNLAWLSPIFFFSLVYPFSANTSNSCGYKQGIFGKSRNQMPKSECMFYSKHQGLLLTPWCHLCWLSFLSSTGKQQRRIWRCGLGHAAVAWSWISYEIETAAILKWFPISKNVVVENNCIHTCTHILSVLIKNKNPKFRKAKILHKRKTLFSERVKTYLYKGYLDKCKVEISIRICMIS